ncbi:transcriptional regulator [Klebsiella michiganensis]|nr:transcriptional regulator [Klebsiella michiganensis]
MMQQNWHPADIIAALKKRGTSLSALAWRPLRWQMGLTTAGPIAKD